MLRACDLVVAKVGNEVKAVGVGLSYEAVRVRPSLPVRPMLLTVRLCVEDVLSPGLHVGVADLVGDPVFIQRQQTHNRVPVVDGG